MKLFVDFYRKAHSVFFLYWSFIKKGKFAKLCEPSLYKNNLNIKTFVCFAAKSHNQLETQNKFSLTL
ncbi:hypothetical protein IW18_09285 [Flavobacterium hibernum]|uniref:Uncharacterized protein n=1 Tax=Flavobacterium hibernum TaxID=37752 RepID=A0A0D0EZE8_9FLAO|nr:hypothetical protein IW18_09285 [Flavobacterium hibernum]OXA84020.1 hypothetical protein B0A73_21330 [Flavobacterium hibernum]